MILSGGALSSGPLSSTPSAGVAAVTGTAAQTWGNFTSACSGTHGVAGTAATTWGPFVSAAEGSHTASGEVTGTAATTWGPFVSAATAVHGVAGTAATTWGAFTSAAAGVHAPPVTGTVAVTWGAFVSLATGIGGIVVEEASATGGWAEAARSRGKKRRGPDPVEVARQELKGELRRIAGEDAPKVPETAQDAPETSQATDTEAGVIASLQALFSPLPAGTVAPSEFPDGMLAENLSGQITDGAPVVQGAEIEINRLAAENAALRQQLKRQRAAFVLLLNG